MAQILVRNLDDAVRDRLRELARRHGRSMEEEIRQILRAAALDGARRRSASARRTSGAASDAASDGDPGIGDPAEVGLGTWATRVVRSLGGGVSGRLGVRSGEEIAELRGFELRIPDFVERRASGKKRGSGRR